MAQIILKLHKLYKESIQEYSDPRTKDMFLAANPLTLITILSLYLYFCNVAGPRYMENRKPYKLKKTLLIYNIFQILISAYLVWGGSAMWLGEYNYYCEPIDLSNNPLAVKMTALVWWYYFSKITELLDTVFFVLRKKNNQITTLHLYHHTVVPMAAWFCIRFFPGGHGTLVGWLNCIVHVVMYSYYLIAGLGPEYQKYVWWKKHVTTIQLIQFCLIFVHNFSVLFRDCNYPKIVNITLAAESWVFIYMFASFYYKAYVKKSNKKL